MSDQGCRKPKEYTSYIGVYFKPKTLEVIKKIAKKRGYSREFDYFGNKIRQPKLGLATTVRDIVEEYIKNHPEP